MAIGMATTDDEDEQHVADGGAEYGTPPAPRYNYRNMARRGNTNARSDAKKPNKQPHENKKGKKGEQGQAQKAHRLGRQASLASLARKEDKHRADKARQAARSFKELDMTLQVLGIDTIEDQDAAGLVSAESVDGRSIANSGSVTPRTPQRTMTPDGHAITGSDSSKSLPAMVDGTATRATPRRHMSSPMLAAMKRGGLEDSRISSGDRAGSDRPVSGREWKEGLAELTETVQQFLENRSASDGELEADVQLATLRADQLLDSIIVNATPVDTWPEWETKMDSLEDSIRQALKVARGLPSSEAGIEAAREVHNKLVPELIKFCVMCCGSIGDGLRLLRQQGARLEDEARAAFQCAKRMVDIMTTFSNQLKKMANLPTGQLDTVNPKEALGEAALQLVSGAVEGAVKIQEELLAPEALLRGGNRSAHEFSAKINALKSTCWRAGVELVQRVGKTWPLKRIEALRMLCQMFHNATQCAITMHHSWSMLSAGMETDDDLLSMPSAWGERPSGAATVVSDEDVEAQAWVPSVLTPLLGRSQEAHRQLVEEVVRGDEASTDLDNTVREEVHALLDRLEASFFELALASMTRTARLCQAPSHLACFALELLQQQAEASLRFVVDYDKSSLSLCVETPEAREMLASLKRRTNQVINGLLVVKRLIKQKHRSDVAELPVVRPRRQQQAPQRPAPAQPAVQRPPLPRPPGQLQGGANMVVRATDQAGRSTRPSALTAALRGPAPRPPLVPGASSQPARTPFTSPFSQAEQLDGPTQELPAPAPAAPYRSPSAPPAVPQAPAESTAVQTLLLHDLASAANKPAAPRLAPPQVSGPSMQQPSASAATPLPAAAPRGTTTMSYALVAAAAEAAARQQPPRPRVPARSPSPPVSSARTADSTLPEQTAQARQQPGTSTSASNAAAKLAHFGGRHPAESLRSAGRGRGWAQPAGRGGRGGRAGSARPPPVPSPDRPTSTPELAAAALVPDATTPTTREASSTGMSAAAGSQLSWKHVLSAGASEGSLSGPPSPARDTTSPTSQASPAKDRTPATSGTSSPSLGLSRQVSQRLTIPNLTMAMRALPAPIPTPQPPSSIGPPCAAPAAPWTSNAPAVSATNAITTPATVAANSTSTVTTTAAATTAAAPPAMPTSTAVAVVPRTPSITMTAPSSMTTAAMAIPSAPTPRPPTFISPDWFAAAAASSGSQSVFATANAHLPAAVAALATAGPPAAATPTTPASPAAVTSPPSPSTPTAAADRTSAGMFAFGSPFVTSGGDLPVSWRDVVKTAPGRQGLPGQGPSQTSAALPAVNSSSSAGSAHTAQPPAVPLPPPAAMPQLPAGDLQLSISSTSSTATSAQTTAAPGQTDAPAAAPPDVTSSRSPAAPTAGGASPPPGSPPNAHVRPATALAISLPEWSLLLQPPAAAPAAKPAASTAPADAPKLSTAQSSPASCTAPPAASTVWPGMMSEVMSQSPFQVQGTLPTFTFPSHTPTSVYSHATTPSDPRSPPDTPTPSPSPAPVPPSPTSPLSFHRATDDTNGGGGSVPGAATLSEDSGDGHWAVPSQQPAGLAPLQLPYDYNPYTVDLLAVLRPDDCDFWRIRWEDLTISSMVTNLGEGSFGQVWQGKLYSADVAIKVINIDFDSPSLETFSSFKREVQVQHRLNHPNIVRFMGACCQLPPNALLHANEPVPLELRSCIKLAIVMELCRMGSLFKMISKARFVAQRMSEAPPEQCAPTEAALRKNCSYGYQLYHSWLLRLEVARGAAAGVHYMHAQGVVHRDLTSYNLLLDHGHPWQCKVCDFNLSRLIGSDPSLRNSGNPNSPGWQSPELLSGQQYGKEADVFSFGVILWELVTLKVPWEDEMRDNRFAIYYIMNSVPKGQRLKFPTMEELGARCPPEVEQVMQLAERCWLEQPSERPTMAQVAKELTDITNRIKHRPSGSA